MLRFPNKVGINKRLIIREQLNIVAPVVLCLLSGAIVLYVGPTGNYTQPILCITALTCRYFILIIFNNLGFSALGYHLHLLCLTKKINF